MTPPREGEGPRALEGLKPVFPALVKGQALIEPAEPGYQAAGPPGTGLSCYGRGRSVLLLEIGRRG